MKPGNLTIFVDESGSPDIVNRYGRDLLAAGVTSKHLVLAALRCADPAPIRAAMAASVAWADSRYGSGIGKTPVTALHATDDRDDVRLHVCQELALLPIKATAIVADKNRARPEWRSDRARFYNDMVGLLLGNQLHVYASTEIVFSHKNRDTLKELEVMARAVAQHSGRVLRSIGRPFPPNVIARDRRARTDPSLQAVDYIAWAVYQAFEHKDMTYWNALAPVLSWVWDLSTMKHHSRRRPMKNPP